MSCEVVYLYVMSQELSGLVKIGIYVLFNAHVEPENVLFSDEVANG